MALPPDRGLLEQVKLGCLASGIRVAPDTRAVLSGDGRVPLTVHEYATTAGLTLVLADDVWVNAPFDEPYCERSSIELVVVGGGLGLRIGDVTVDVERFIPLPGFLEATDGDGHAVTDTVMAHGDRIRVSPIMGCAFDCAFCDLPASRYTRRSAEQIIAGLRIAATDDVLPTRHLLISGGSPGAAHHAYFEDVCRQIIHAAADLEPALEVDVMMSPWTDDPDLVTRLTRAGVHGWSINTEIYSDAASVQIIGKKHRFARPGLEAFIERAVAATGGEGRVRSLLVVGLEPADRVLEAVEWLASRGCDPVLSPFRPARRTALASADPVPVTMLAGLLPEARRIAASHGAALGPRCVPCQHNTLTFPWDVPAMVTALA